MTSDRARKVEPMWLGAAPTVPPWLLLSLNSETYAVLIPTRRAASPGVARSITPPTLWRAAPVDSARPTREPELFFADMRAKVKASKRPVRLRASLTATHRHRTAHNSSPPAASSRTAHTIQWRRCRPGRVPSMEVSKTRNCTAPCGGLCAAIAYTTPRRVCFSMSADSCCWVPRNPGTGG